jgi:transposase/ribosomal protein S14
MYCDPILWKNVRSCVLKDGISRRGAARKFGLARNTVRKMLSDELPPPRKKRTRRRPMIGPHEATITRMVNERSRSGYGYSPRISRIFEFISQEENYLGSYSAVRDYVLLLQDGPVPAKISEDTWMYSSDVLFSIGHQKAALFLKAMSHGRQPVLSEAKVKSFAQKAMGYRGKNQPTLDKHLSYGRAKDWLHSIAAGTMTADAIALSVGETEDLEELLQIAGCGNRIKRNRALTILGSKAGFSIRSIAAALKIARGSCAKHVALYREFGPEGLLQRKRSTNRKYDNSALKDAVFALLHEPPSNYDINRTTWRMEDFRCVLAKCGHSACPQVLRKILKDAGYRWRKAKIVLTSQDPEYSAKLASIQNILSNLTKNDAFFSIDEFGPFAVKMKGGRSLVGPGVEPVVPQWQKSKGCLIMTAALELSTNQVTHFYSKKKNTAEMIKLMDILVNQYSNRKQIFLSWDAASWHISKDLNLHIERHNSEHVSNGLPKVLVAPLPSGAQFLNVIESVFSGMARAIIHNSNYGSADDAKTAIDRYFSERNAKFMQSPSRAGKKIWGLERELPIFSPSSNFKDPLFR